MQRGGGQPDATGRSRSSRFVRLDHSLLESPASRALSPNGRALLNELARMENGRNNGTGLYLSVRDAAALMGVADDTAASRAFLELQDLGFIDCTAEAHFAVKAGAGSRARFWRLTWQSVPGERGPTNDFREREPPPQTTARRRMIAGQKALKRWHRRQAEEKSAVAKSATQKVKRVAKSSTTIEAEDA